MTETNKPEREFKAGGVRVTLWKNERTRKDGSKFDAYSYGVERRYKDEKSGEWKSTNSYGAGDVPKLIALLQDAYRYSIITERDPQAEE